MSDVPERVLLIGSDLIATLQTIQLLLPTLSTVTHLFVATTDPQMPDAIAAVIRPGAVIIGWAVETDMVDAINRAAACLFDGTVYGQADAIAVVACDAHPLACGWLPALRRELWPTAIVDADNDPRPAMAFPLGAPIGLVGPVCERAATLAQRAVLTEAEAAMGPPAYSERRQSAFAGIVSVAETLDPFCWLISLAAWQALGQILLRPISWRGSFLTDPHDLLSMTDLVIRAEMAGFRSVVAEGVYVARDQNVPSRPEWPLDPWHRIALLATDARGPVGRPRRVIATVRAQIRSLRDLHLLRGTISRAGAVADGVAIVCVNNPLDAQDHPSFPRSAAQLEQIPELDRRLLRDCSNASADRVAQALTRWAAAHIVGSAPKGQPVAVAVAVEPSADALAVETRLDALVGDCARQHGDVVDVWILALQRDEMLEESVTREFLARLIAHPNPGVVGYDLPLLVLWDAPRLVREDAPWGDGGTWKGGPSGVRLFRRGRPIPPGSLAPVIGRDGIRIASARLRKTSLMRVVDRVDGELAFAEDGMRISALQTSNRIGLHVLVYERESADDVGRWLDDLHGVVDDVVLVWTSTLPLDEWKGDIGTTADNANALGLIAESYGARWIHHPLADDLAGARNAGIAALAEAGMTWALFVDPDEWLGSPIDDARALRRAAESGRWGWMQQVANFAQPGQQPSVSDSIRMSRCDPRMTMSGRVHEGFSDALQGLQRAGIHPRIVYLPFMLRHRGMALGEERTREKLDQYEALLRLELADNPRNPGAWVSLGWHYSNDGHEDQAVECLQRAILCAGQAYLPFRELGLIHLREARRLYEACQARLSGGHNYAGQAGTVVDWLRQHAPPPARRTRTPRAAQPLPDFPSEDAPAATGYAGLGDG